MRSNLLRTDQPDGFATTPIGRWALEKYRLVSLYGRLFATGMKGKWPERVYVDLCAGSGFSAVEGTSTLYWGSPLIALGAPHPFTKHVFCERDLASLQALRSRVKRLFPAADVCFIEGDCDEQIDKIVSQIPSGSGVLALCFADPFDLSIKFSTVRRLGELRIDFLFVLALHMDANRNAAHYSRSENRKIDEFLGKPDWRPRWKAAEAKGISFPRFLAETFSAQMESMGYLAMPFHEMKQIRDDSNRPLYHLSLFSKHKLALTFWKEVRKYSTDQTSFNYD